MRFVITLTTVKSMNDIEHMTDSYLEQQQTRMNCFRYLKRMSPLNAAFVQQPISKDKNVMARARTYYSKNNYLTS